MQHTILFDLDGTLTDPAPGIVGCLQHAQRRLGLEPWQASQLLRFIGPPLHLGLAEILNTDDETMIAQAVAHYRERFSTVGLFENAVYAGISALLDELRRRDVRLFVATSKPTVFSERIVEYFELGRYFSRVYGSELSGERTNKSELIGHIAEREGLDPECTLMIGDRCHDVVGAKTHGIATIGVLWGYGSREELETAGARELVDTVGELGGYLLRWLDGGARSPRQLT